MQRAHRVARRLDRHRVAHRRGARRVPHHFMCRLDQTLQPLAVGVALARAVRRRHAAVERGDARPRRRRRRRRRRLAAAAAAAVAPLSLAVDHLGRRGGRPPPRRRRPLAVGPVFRNASKVCAAASCSADDMMPPRSPRPPTCRARRAPRELDRRLEVGGGAALVAEVPLVRVEVAPVEERLRERPHPLRVVALRRRLREQLSRGSEMGCSPKRRARWAPGAPW